VILGLLDYKMKATLVETLFDTVGRFSFF
jgi:hypothetical protein